MRRFNRKAQKPIRQHLRREATPAERALWTGLRNKALGVRFRRQHGVGRYVLDFYCPEVRLAVELDGAAHDSPEAQDYDDARTRWLGETHGIRVLRFENRTVFEQPDDVLAAIRRAVAEAPEVSGELRKT
ncbi:endonuclease domain-containing protein [Rubricoccus marinus]|uniref:DUF559 domain-containing protein n=1 Tax=Rubricoccus marinus TaxID=716817 RepID=A0A259U0T2_9BACT|nr:endonuclease domain-containing protein [Rubricoccus marinus]OZC03550.1 hypothetical protein BSZ36_11495 [Rubricoccus marinus]